MVSLMQLWLPILVSAVFVFIASNILWMALPWHRKDYKKLPDESGVVKAVAGTASGQYIFPHVDWKYVNAEQKEAIMSGPGGLMIVRNPYRFSLGPSLALFFLYNLVISFFVGYLASHSLAAGAHYLAVFRIVGTAGILAYSFGQISDSIWYGKPWSITIKFMIDGVIYGLLMAGTFGWLWPK